MAKKKMSFEDMTPEEGRKFIGPNLNFAAAEAYKRLRTNIQFSLTDRKKCKIIGVTSALKGEGKSTTSLNIAYTFAQTGQKVLLMECDLRLPNIAKRLAVHSRPGLSNLLAGQCSGNDVLQRCTLLEKVHVIVAGDIPPNPAELIASEQMQQTMDALAQVFDVIIVDLPPVTVVSDAAIASKLVDGLVLVTRKDYCDKRAIADTVGQLRFADAKILGFVFTGGEPEKKRYKKYYKKNYDSYNKSAAKAAEKQTSEL